MDSMICPNCGHTIPNNVTFCPDCGVDLTQSMTDTLGDFTSRDQQRENQDSQPGRTQSRQQRLSDSWQHRLIPNLAHLKQVWQFILNNTIVLLAVYLVSLIFSNWRWAILVLFLITSYLFPLLTGRTAFFGHGPIAQPSRTPLVGPQEERQPANFQSEAHPAGQPIPTPKQHRSRRIFSNSEFKIGSVILIPSLIGYLVAKQVIGTTTQSIFNRSGLGMTANVYIICLGGLGIAVAMVLGGFLKGLIGHPRGGQRFKRWGLGVAILTILLGLALYQNANTGNLSTSASLVDTIGKPLVTWLPWGAGIAYVVGIFKNLITPQSIAR
ncbi:zinc ribbon domain-containing protein [Secundilactobacillus odoratitofui]|nr:zinc ribbon domain-containing protein [Secundilactobacillus odoratitofui]